MTVGSFSLVFLIFLQLWLIGHTFCFPTKVHIVTQWSGSGGTEAYLSGQLASYSALMLLVGSSGL